MAKYKLDANALALTRFASKESNVNLSAYDKALKEYNPEINASQLYGLGLNNSQSNEICDKLKDGLTGKKLYEILTGYAKLKDRVKDSDLGLRLLREIYLNGIKNKDEKASLRNIFRDYQHNPDSLVSPASESYKFTGLEGLKYIDDYGKIRSIKNFGNVTELRQALNNAVVGYQQKADKMNKSSLITELTGQPLLSCGVFNDCLFESPFNSLKRMLEDGGGRLAYSIIGPYFMSAAVMNKLCKKNKVEKATAIFEKLEDAKKYILNQRYIPHNELKDEVAGSLSGFGGSWSSTIENLAKEKLKKYSLEHLLNNPNKVISATKKAVNEANEATAKWARIDEWINKLADVETHYWLENKDA